MTIHDQTLTILKTDDHILQLFRQTSPGDRSILPMMLDRENGVGTTSPDSPNDRLWSRFADHGWMVSIPDTSGIPGTRQFRLTELGRRALPVLLPLLYQQLAPST